VIDGKSQTQFPVTSKYNGLTVAFWSYSDSAETGHFTQGYTRSLQLRPIVYYHIFTKTRVYNVLHSITV